MAFILKNLTEAELSNLGLPYIRGHEKVAIDIERNVALVAKPIHHSHWPEQYLVLSINGYVTQVVSYGEERKGGFNAYSPVPPGLQIRDDVAYAELVGEALACFYESPKPHKVEVFNRLTRQPRPIAELVDAINTLAGFPSPTVDQLVEVMNGYLDFEHDKINFAHFLDTKDGKGLTTRALEVSKKWKIKYRSPSTKH